MLWVDEGIISRPFVDLGEPNTGEQGIAGVVCVLAAITAPRRKSPRPLPGLRVFGTVVCLNNGDAL